jgi:hypothetical protein
LSIRFEITGIQGLPGPLRLLKFGFKVESWHDRPAFLAGLDGKLSYNNLILSDKVQFHSYQFQNGSSFRLIESPYFQGDFITSISSEALKLIEDSRKDGDVQLTLNLIYQWQKILQTQVPTNQNLTEGIVQVGPVRWSETSTFYTIPKSTWLNILKQLQYSEIELFEVNKLSFSEDDNLKQAFGYLREAETQLRSGNYDGVLGDCRSAFESAAKYASAGKVEKGFDLILEKSFPGVTQKREPFNGLIDNISKFSHLGRHAGYPPEPISRDEAEFIYIATMDIFSFISRRLKQ